MYFFLFLLGNVVLDAFFVTFVRQLFFAHLVCYRPLFKVTLDGFHNTDNGICFQFISVVLPL